MIFIGKEAVAERDDVSMPTIALQEVERYRRAVIEIESIYSVRGEIFFSRGFRDLIQQFVIQFGVNRRSRRPKHCEIAVKLRSVVRDKRVRFKWSVRRNQDDGFGAAGDHSLS